MKNILALILVFPLVAFSNSNSLSSAQRLPNETFQDSLNRIQKVQMIHKSLIARDTPLGKKTPVNKINFSNVVEVKNHEQLIHLFNIIRDSRFLQEQNSPDFDRRISWLYPDDGCFARAALSGMKLTEEELPRPSKIFVFGDLVVQTPYSVYGSVSWWYHVAPIVKLADMIYVLDPALNFNDPILVEDWFNMMGNSAELKGTVCNPYTYDPFDSCYSANAESDSRALNDEQNYLNKEWSRMIVLGLEPNIILGKNPPWFFDLPQ